MTTEAPLCYATATDLAARIQGREVSSLEVTKAFLARIDEHDPTLHALAQRFDDEALSRAAEADAALARGESWGPLHGVPVTIKEQFWIAGTPSTLNSKRNRGFVASEDAVIVTRIKRAGAVVLGKTNVPAELTDYQVRGDIYPECKNPYDLDRSPGGSTGGGAAALAAGLTPLELGADLGGSIRVPAAFCGVFGLKPSERTIPRHGHVPLPIPAKRFLVHLVQAGPLARSLDDLELLWNLIRGPHESDFEVSRIAWRAPSARSLADLRVAWTDGWGDHVASTETRELFGALADRLASAGARVEKTAPPIAAQAADVFCRLFGYVVGQDMPWLVRKVFPIVMSRTLFKGHPKLRAIVARALQMDAQDYAEALNLRRTLVESVERFFGAHDVLLCPVAFGPAYPRCDQGTPLDYDGERRPYLDYCWPFVSPWNASGNPALVMPLGRSKEGLPIGVQLVGPYWSEPELFDIARKLAPLTCGFAPPRAANT
jgi:amidase